MNPVLGRCGDHIGDHRGDDGPLVMTGSFPARVAAGEEERFHGTVTVTNRADATMSGTSPTEPDILVTRAGRIVATPVARDDLGLLVDLAPGASVAFPATGSLLACAADTRGIGQDGPPLAPGGYEVHAVLTILAGRDGKAVTAVGGPWPLEVI